MELLTVSDVAARLGVTVWRVHQLIKEQRLPAVKLGSQYVINEKDLELVRDRRRTGRPPKAKAK
ncbi:MAG: helix-turn-helix domain-containing protein [Acidobacteriota bacterium]|nr:helix-turn-helix domain-containing protein [Acidobacteriota bacterium]